MVVSVCIDEFLKPTLTLPRPSVSDSQSKYAILVSVPTCLENDSTRLQCHTSILPKAALNRPLFKLKPGSAAVTPAPPKDSTYASSLNPSLNVKPLPFFMLQQVSLQPSGNSSSYTLGQATIATIASVKPKKSVFKLANLARRNRSRKDVSDTASYEDAPGKQRG
ncbi:hypothetical protein J3R82DRAFT_8942 [Butyriboletus roseoflavus]|nr:hypothetical protein J3R82DRAFT_8942 [Butyriboletus roseoflavus]